MPTCNEFYSRKMVNSFRIININITFIKHFKKLFDKLNKNNSVKYTKRFNNLNKKCSKCGAPICDKNKSGICIACKEMISINKQLNEVKENIDSFIKEFKYN